VTFWAEVWPGFIRRATILVIALVLVGIVMPAAVLLAWFLWTVTVLLVTGRLHQP